MARSDEEEKEANDSSEEEQNISDDDEEKVSFDAKIDEKKMSQELKNASEGWDISDDEEQEEKSERSIEVTCDENKSESKSVDISDNVEKLVNEIEDLVDDDEAKDLASEFNCDECGTSFTEKEDMSIHIGEVHMEEELLTWLAVFFPVGSIECSVCQEATESEYEKKEHTIIKHPWPLLMTALGDKETAAAKNEKIGNANGGQCHKSEANILERGNKEEENKSKLDAQTTIHEGNDNSIKLSNRTLKWHTGIIYSCNYCKYEHTTNMTRHLNAVHKMKMGFGEFSKHVTFEAKKYECKICHRKLSHSWKNIRSHIIKKHNLSLDQYEAKYELSNAENSSKWSNIEEDDITKVQTPSSELKMDESEGSKLVDNSTYSHNVQISRLSSAKDPIDTQMKKSDEPNNGLVDKRKVDIVEKKTSNEFNINGLIDTIKVDQIENVQLNTRKRKISQGDLQEPKKSSLMHEIDEMELFMERLRSKMVETQRHKTGPGRN